MLWAAALSVAHAELAPPDYRAALLASVEAQADALIDQRRYDEALALVGDFRERVADDARLIYEEGLIYRHKGELDWALQRMEAAVAQDPGLGFAWYDLGEVRLLLGLRPAAAQAFSQAVPLTAEHPSGWVVPLKLAEMAAQDGDAAGWDQWLRESLRRGFTLSQVADHPAWAAQWRAHATDPELTDVLEHLARVYAEEAALRRILAAP